MIKKIIDYFKKKKEKLKYYDKDFWGKMYLEDVEEEENNVRYSFGLYEPINWFNNTYDSTLYFIWLDRYFIIW